VRIRPDESQGDLLAGLWQRREEIEQAVIARVRAIGETGDIADPDYLDGLKRAISTAVRHSIDASRGVEDSSGPIPGAILAQARLAAQRQVRLETLLRRYLAGHAIVGDFTVEEAERRAVPAGILRGVLRSQAARTDQVLAAISASYIDEATAIRPRSSDRRRTDRVRRMLDGELVDPSILDYGLNRRHLGFVASGASVAAVIDAFADAPPGNRLIVNGDSERLWIWIASPVETKPWHLRESLPRKLPKDLRIGIGEPGHGLPGWRLTHEQALAAHSIAMRRAEPEARYADVALLASSLRDELLMTSLRGLYISPLEEGTTDPDILRNTVRAYFAADRNVSSTAASLGISRNTVASRLRAVENKVGPLRTVRTAQFLLALQLNELEPAD
jgi:PucR C-terminal helix-turn-helix domain/GGDEF-like domain